MNVNRIRALRGPNLWTQHTAIEAVVSCTPEECAITADPGFEIRLRTRFPAISPLQPTGHDSKVTLAHVLGLAAIDLQAHAGSAAVFV